MTDLEAIKAARLIVGSMMYHLPAAPTNSHAETVFYTLSSLIKRVDESSPVDTAVAVMAKHGRVSYLWEDIESFRSIYLNTVDHDLGATATDAQILEALAKGMEASLTCHDDLIAVMGALGVFRRNTLDLLRAIIIASAAPPDQSKNPLQGGA